MKKKGNSVTGLSLSSFSVTSNRLKIPKNKRKKTITFGLKSRSNPIRFWCSSSPSLYPHTSLNEPNACFIIVYTYTLSPITVCVSSTILNSFFPSFPWWWWWWWQNNDSSTSLSYFLDRQQVLLFPLSHSLFLFHSTHLPFLFFAPNEFLQLLSSPPTRQLLKKKKPAACAPVGRPILPFAHSFCIIHFLSRFNFYPWLVQRQYL